MGFCPFFSHQVPFPCPEDSSCKLWDGDCVFNRQAAGGGSVMEFFKSVQFGGGGAGEGVQGYQYRWQIDSAGELVFLTFRVPADFTSLTSALVIGISGYTGDASQPMSIALDSQYGVLDELYRLHTEADALQDNEEGTSTGNDLLSWDASGVLSGITAGDIVGIRISYHAGVGGISQPTYIFVLGLAFKYS